MDDIEKQVERAMQRYELGKDSLRQAMRDLLAGKFKEEPLPEIARPPWPYEKFGVHEGQRCFFVTVTGNDGWSGMCGPDRDTKREAIEAWNAVFAKRDER